MIDKRLLAELKSKKHYQVLVVVNGIVSFTAAFFQALFIARLVDNIFIKHQAFERQGLLLAGVLGIILLKALLQFLLEKRLRISSLYIKMELQKRAIRAMLENGPSAVKSESAGAKMTAVCEAADDIEPYFHEFIPQLFTVGITVPLILTAVLFLDPLSFFIMLFTAPLLPFFLALIGMASARLNSSRLKSLQRLGGSFLDILNGMRTLKLFGQSRTQAQNIYGASEAFRKTTMEVLRVSFLSAFVLELAATISTALIAVSLGLRLLYGKMEFFDAFFILLLAPEYYQPIRQFGAKFHTAMAAKAAADKIYELAQRKEKPAGPEEQFSDLVAVEKPDIRCRDLFFSYEKERKAPALKGVNLELRYNEITALVGKSGAGKSTLAAALLRFIEPDSGEILFGGVNIKNISVDSLRSRIAYIPQRPFIFHDTIMENVRFSRPEATPEEVWAAIGKAAAEEFVRALPQGIDTVLAEEGNSISRGEAQRLAVARAILKNAPLVIIDEATSGLDEKNEALLKKSFEELSRERTVLIIAHRLETVKNAGRIYVMDGGGIVDGGTHEQLLKKEGIYKELVAVWEGDYEAAD